MPIIDFLRSIFAYNIFINFLLAVFAVKLPLNLKALSETDSRERIRQELIEGTSFFQTYLWGLNRLLNWVDKHLGRKPWSAVSFYWCFWLAMIYPLLSYHIVWLVTGEKVTPLSFYEFESNSKSQIILSFLSLAIGVVTLLFFYINYTKWNIWKFIKTNKIKVDIENPIYKSCVLFLSSFVFVILMSICLIFFFDNSVTISAVIVFFGLLPLVNVIFDWCSLAVTREFLGQIPYSGNPIRLMQIIRNGLLDFLIALFLFILLCWSLTLVIAVYNQMILAYGGKPVLELPSLFSQLKAAPSDPSLYWVYATLLTTLIPTFIHGFIVGFSIFTSFPLFQKLRGPILMALLNGVEEDFTARNRIACILAARTCAAIFLSFFFFYVAYHLIIFMVPHAGDYLLASCEWISQFVAGLFGR